MKLLLTSAGFTNKTIVSALQQLIKKPFNELNFAFIPTAANVEPGEKDWLVTDISNAFNLKWKQFDIVDFSAVPKDIWLPRLKEADVFLFGGGSSEHLMACLHASGLGEMLPELLKNKVYVGISAGSMICAPEVSLSAEQLLYYEKTKTLGKIPALGFADFEIRPHLNSKDFPKVRIDYLTQFAKEQHDINFYAIDDNTAVKIDGGSLEVVTEGEWKKFN